MVPEQLPLALLIESYTDYAITAVSILLSLAALLHCAFQKPASFPAVGPLSKGAWLAILAGCMLLSALGVFGQSGYASIFGLIGLVAALVYLLDIRRAIRDLGSNPW
ncbi:MAG: DUF2516 family protein [Stackebrandtia sp.]